MEEIKNKLFELDPIINNYSERNNISLLSGEPGIDLFNFYYYLMSNNEKTIDQAIFGLEKNISSIENNGISLIYSSGLSGIGKLLKVLTQSKLIELNIDEFFNESVKLLRDYSIQLLKDNDNDFLHGGLGIVFFLLDFENTKNQKNYLKKALNILYDNSCKVKNTIAWKSVNNLNEQIYNLSISHGMSSIIIILSKIYKYDNSLTLAKDLIEGGLNFILQHKLDSELNHSIYPSILSKQKKNSKSSRLAWCYGDLGIGFAFLHAGRALNREDWITEAHSIFLHASNRRDLEINGVLDSPICHGTSGIAHIYNRLFIDTRIQKYKETSDYWFDQTLKLAKFEDGLAGFKSYVGPKYGMWENKYGLLEGIAGIGLTLISKVSDIEPAWDELFLLS